MSRETKRTLREWKVRGSRGPAAKGRSCHDSRARSWSIARCRAERSFRLNIKADSRSYQTRKGKQNVPRGVFNTSKHDLFSISSACGRSRVQMGTHVSLEFSCISI